MAVPQVSAKILSWRKTKKKMTEKLNTLNGKNGGVPPQFRDIPNPKEKEDQVVDFDDLADPPEDFCQRYRRWLLDNAKYPAGADGVRFIDFYFWGIDHHSPTNQTSRAECLVKLFYNMEPEYCVNTKNELEYVKIRDAGPRLLKREILERLGIPPISRFYPETPEEGDAWEQQRSAPVIRPLVEEIRPQEPDQRLEDGPRAIPQNLNHIRESLERLLIQFRYTDLEVPQGAEKYQPQATPVTLLSTSDHEFTESDQGINYLRWGRGPIAGEQDPWQKTACDCIMMAAKFLDAGITNIDIDEKNSPGVPQTTTHEFLTNAVRANWESPSISTNTAAQREIFHQNFLEGQPQNFQELIRFSTLLRKQFCLSREEARFCEDEHKNVIDGPFYHKSMTLPGQPGTADIGGLLQEAFGPVLSESPPVAELHQEIPPDPSVEHDPNESRPKCSVQDCQKHVRNPQVCYTMPLRLAIFPTQKEVPANHTSDDVRFTITNKKGKNQTVAYRWLGGIYSDDTTHHRVYWTDAKRWDNKGSSIRMYDPSSLGGSVIGGIKPARDGSLIPPKWQPLVIFYEAILNPHTLDLTTTTAVLGDMGHATVSGNFILRAHNEPRSSSMGSGGDPGQGPGGQIFNGGHLDTEFVMPTMETSSMGANGDTNNIPIMPNPSGFNPISQVDFSGNGLPDIGSHNYNLNNLGEFINAYTTPMDLNMDLNSGYQHSYNGFGILPPQNSAYHNGQVPQQATQSFAQPLPGASYQPWGMGGPFSQQFVPGASNANGRGQNSMYQFGSGIPTVNTPISNSTNQPKHGQFQTKRARTNQRAPGPPRQTNRTRPNTRATSSQYQQPNNNSYTETQVFDEGDPRSTWQLPENLNVSYGQLAEYGLPMGGVNMYNGNSGQDWSMPDVDPSSEPQPGESAPRKKRQGDAEDRGSNKRTRRGR